MTPPSKEGPATPRECRNAILAAVSKPNENGNFITSDDLAAVLHRLTDEALERDKKRRAALEKVAKIAADAPEWLLMEGHGVEEGNLGRELKKALDVLTPAPKERTE